MVVTTLLSLAYVIIASIVRHEVRTFNFKFEVLRHEVRTFNFKFEVLRHEVRTFNFKS
jgi:hypothetical protein